MKTVALLLLVVVAAWASPQGYGAPTSGGQDYQSGPAVYNFQWDVNDSPSSNFYGQNEDRDGDNTQGSYYVQLPGNRQLKVDYTVDEFGFHPVVTYGSGGQGSGGQGYQ
ncbi:pro-resilin-like [Homarus americanus]|uniref:Pro-resilin-like 150 n=1 Tax=Homarus americanus TaxID=6706 RepID=A0A8J5MLW6_HOMAM|nr:pro-resilin-like [Homarus americanus]KAG7156065.1 Pro-resilin-like 150 [Homarus americanus]